MQKHSNVTDRTDRVSLLPGWSPNLLTNYTVMKVHKESDVYKIQQRGSLSFLTLKPWNYGLCFYYKGHIQ